MESEMAAKVKVSLVNHILSREESGVWFDVFSGKTRLGHLIVSKGGLRWRPKSKKGHHHVGWRRFELFMREQPRR
jgi:hypothetical protein